MRVTALGIGLAVAVVGCGNSSSGPTVTLKLAASVDQSGTSGSKSWVDALNLAIGDVNSGLKNASSPIRFELVLSDSVNTPSITVPLVVDAVQKQHALAVI